SPATYLNNYVVVTLDYVSRIAALLDGAGRQLRARDAADIVQRAGHIVVEICGAAIDADHVGVAEAAEVFGVGVADALASAGAGLLRQDRSLQRVIVLLVTRAESPAVGRRHEDHAADGLVDDADQAQLFQVLARR